MKSRNLMFCVLIGLSIFVSLKQSSLHFSLKSFVAVTSTNDERDTVGLASGSTISSNEAATFLKIRPSFKLQEYIFFILLVLQTGCQPLLIKLCMPTTIVRTTAILGQEGIKFMVSILFLASSGTWRELLGDWSISDSILAAGIPSGLFVIQNYCNLMANQVLPPVTFVVLNQTKTLSTAWCCFVIMGQKQSLAQVAALVLLVVSILIVQKIIPLGRPRDKTSATTDSDHDRRWEHIKNESDSKLRKEGEIESARLIDGMEESSQVLERTIQQQADYEEAGRQLTMGVIPALCASFLSGLAGTFSQRTLQTHQRNPHVFNMELASFSATFLFASLAAGSPDCQKIKHDGLQQGWTLKTWVPIVSNGFGGILVGLVTKYQGAVVKSFAMIFGMVISGVLQQMILSKEGGGVTREQQAGAIFGAISLYLHASYPP